MKAGKVYRSFTSKSGEEVTLRAAKWEDLQAMIEFANSLVDERTPDPDFGVILDRRQDLESESQWLANLLAGIESDRELSVVAEVRGKLVGNSEVRRGSVNDEFHHGKLGISVSKGYREQGIGLEMMKTLVEESRKAGLKTIELEVFATNPRAVHVYEKVGFRQVGRIPKKIFRNNRFIDIILMAMVL